MESDLSVLREHVERFNAGVRAGDFGPMLEHFTPDAVLVFEGVPVGPFSGKDAIAEAYREQPPDDEILISDERVENGDLVASYAWAREPAVRAGELRLKTRDGAIAGMHVTFG